MSLRAAAFVLLTLLMSVGACSSSPSTSDRDAAKDADATTDASGEVAECEPRAPSNHDNIPYTEIDGVEPNLLSLDIYSPATQGCEQVPVVVWVHGGAWALGDKTGQIAGKISLIRDDLGYMLVSVNYRLSPSDPDQLNTPGRVMHPTHVEDVAAALDWVAEHAAEYGADADRVAILGHSAGAHLVALAATDGAYLGEHGRDPTMLDCVGSYDTEAYDIPAKIAAGGLRQRAIMTNAFGDDEQVWLDASPITHVAADKDLPPFQLARRGSADRQAILDSFKQALEDAGGSTHVIDASGYTHAQVNRQIGEPDEEVMTPAVRRFLQDVCFGP